MALVGNKADLQENRSVSKQDAIEYAEKNGMFFVETSAKPADNVNQLFEVFLQFPLGEVAPTFVALQLECWIKAIAIS